MTAKEKADAGMFLSIRELSKVIGISYRPLSRISKQRGFPMLSGKVTLPDFQAWYRQKVEEGETSPRLRSAACRRSGAADKSGVRLRKRDLQLTEQSVQEHQSEPIAK